MYMSNLCLHVCDQQVIVASVISRPKAALLFWFFGGFRCGVPFFIVILVIYIIIKIGKNRC